jgi:hypothetical protein
MPVEPSSPMGGLLPELPHAETLYPKLAVAYEAVGFLGWSICCRLGCWAVAADARVSSLVSGLSVKHVGHSEPSSHATASMLNSALA